MFHFNFPLESGEELLVDFSLESGPKARCHYCGKPGFQSLVEVECIVCDGVLIDKDSSLYWAAVGKIRQTCFHKRGRCEPQTECAEKFWDEVFAALDDLGT